MQYRLRQRLPSLSSFSTSAKRERQCICQLCMRSRRCCKSSLKQKLSLQKLWATPSIRCGGYFYTVAECHAAAPDRARHVSVLGKNNLQLQTIKSHITPPVPWVSRAEASHEHISPSALLDAQLLFETMACVKFAPFSTPPSLTSLVLAVP